MADLDETVVKALGASRPRWLSGDVPRTDVGAHLESGDLEEPQRLCLLEQQSQAPHLIHLHPREGTSIAPVSDLFET